METDIAYRLLRLEQHLASYEQLHAQELLDMRQELDALKRQVVLRTVWHATTSTIEVDATLCNGCGQCVPACPQKMLELKELDGRSVVRVIAHLESNQVQACVECQLETPPCVAVCVPSAIILP